MSKREILKLIGIVALSFGVLIYSLLPELSDFRNSIYGTLVILLALIGILLHVTISKKIDMPILGKITVWGFLAVILLSYILDFGKIEALFFFIYSVINILVSVYLYKKTNIAYRSVFLFGVLAFFSNIIFTSSAEFINSDWWKTLVIPSIVVAVLTLIPCLIYAIRAFQLSKDWQLIFIPLLGIIGGFGITFFTVGAMNVYLDTSTPTYEEFIIVDKNVNAGSNRITSYAFEVKNENVTFTIHISEEAYYDYEIGASITLSIYDGAFNEPYYIYEDNN